MIYSVNSADQAVELAQIMKNIGGYDLFRGQGENWPLVSALARLSDEKREKEQETLESFFAWVHSTKELEYLWQNEDTMWAVAQHHGLRTHYIDFTTDPAVAGYFASENAGKSRGPSCIMCLKTSDLLNFWKVLPPKYPQPRIVRVDVPNLWRLQAQKGIFLLCNLVGFERIYNLDRILFSPTKTVSSPTRDEIYPHNKSNLEKLLDQWIMTERLKAGSEVLFENPDFTKLSWEAVSYPEEEILTKRIGSYQGWDEDLSTWRLTKREDYFNVKHAKAEIRVEVAIEAMFQKGYLFMRDSLASQLLQQIEANKDIRDRLANFQCLFNGKDDHGLKLDSQPLEALWDGLRNLPYNNQEVAEGLANCVMLQILRQADEFRQIQSWESWEPIASCLFGETVEIEFCCQDSSYSRGFASKNDLLGAVRPDLEEFLKAEFREVLYSKNMAGLLQLVPFPNLLFDFRKLAHLFAIQICPIQVLTRSSLAVFYTPAQLEKLGLP